MEALEVRLLLEAVHERYGLVFREYAGASVRRRIRARLAPEGVTSVSELQAKVLHDPQLMERLLLGLTVHVTSMFRHPSRYLALGEKESIRLSPREACYEALRPEEKLYRKVG